MQNLLTFKQFSSPAPVVSEGYGSSEEGQVFIRIPWYESNEWQCFTLVSFVIFSFIGFVIAVLSIKNRKKYGRYFFAYFQLIEASFLGTVLI